MARLIVEGWRIKIIKMERNISSPAKPSRQRALCQTSFNKGRSQAVARAKPSGQEIAEAANLMGDFFHRMETAGTWDQVTEDDLMEISKLVKITGRRKMLYGGPNYNFNGTAGKLLDRMNHIMGVRLSEDGKLPKLTPSAPTAIAMAKKLALYTGGTYTWKHPTTWITSHGYRHRDPADHVEYPDNDAFERGWAFLSGIAEDVPYRDHLGSERIGLKFGKYLLERASTVSGVGAGMRERFLISVRTVGALKNPSVVVRR